MSVSLLVMIVLIAVLFVLVFLWLSKNGNKDSQGRHLTAPRKKKNQEPSPPLNLEGTEAFIAEKASDERLSTQDRLSLAKGYILEENMTEAHILLDSLATRLFHPNSPLIDEEKELLKLFIDIGSYDRALDIVHPFLLKYPSDPFAYIQLSRLSLHVGHFSAAQNFLDKILYIGIPNYLYAALYTSLHLLKGEYEKATIWNNRQLTYTPEHPLWTTVQFIMGFSELSSKEHGTGKLALITRNAGDRDMEGLWPIQIALINSWRYRFSCNHGHEYTAEEKRLILPKNLPQHLPDDVKNILLHTTVSAFSEHEDLLKSIITNNAPIFHGALLTWATAHPQIPINQEWINIAHQECLSEKMSAIQLHYMLCPPSDEEPESAQNATSEGLSRLKARVDEITEKTHGDHSTTKSTDGSQTSSQATQEKHILEIIHKTPIKNVELLISQLARYLGITFSTISFQEDDPAGPSIDGANGIGTLKKDGTSVLLYFRRWDHSQVGSFSIAGFNDARIISGSKHGYYLSTGLFSEEAKNFAKKHPGLIMLDRRDISHLIHQQPEDALKELRSRAIA